MATDTLTQEQVDSLLMPMLRAQNQLTMSRAYGLSREVRKGLLEEITQIGKKIFGQEITLDVMSYDSSNKNQALIYDLVFDVLDGCDNSLDYYLVKHGFIENNAWATVELSELTSIIVDAIKSYEKDKNLKHGPIYSTTHYAVDAAMRIIKTTVVPKEYRGDSDESTK